MASYHRFVSYIYQLENGRKGANCGFVKIELKNNICSLCFQIKNLSPQKHITISFFLPIQEQMQFLPIWEGIPSNGFLKLNLTTDSLHIFNTNYSFRQCSGIVFSQKDEILYGTCWDNEVEIPSKMILKTDVEKPSENEKTDGKTDEDTERLFDKKDVLATKEKESITDESVLTGKENTLIDEEKVSIAENEAAIDENELHQKAIYTFEQQWNTMQQTFPALDPFEEGGIVEGISITPSDLPLLECLPFDICANRFLLHGYKNYHHLLLGRMEGQNRYILGVPGIFDSQEQFMAKTFGFPCFKPIRPYLKPSGQFGYWFRCIKS